MRGFRKALKGSNAILPNVGVCPYGKMGLASVEFPFVFPFSGSVVSDEIYEKKRMGNNGVIAEIDFITKKSLSLFFNAFLDELNWQVMFYKTQQKN